MGGVGEGLAGREILKLSLQGAARSCFFQDSQKKIAAFRPPCCVCWQMQRRLLPPAPCVRRGMTMLCHLRAVCSPSSTMYAAHGHVRREARAHRPSTWRSRCCSAPARHKRQFFFFQRAPTASSQGSPHLVALTGHTKL